MMFFVTSCKNFGQKDDANSIQGNWLILYPDHELTNDHQRKVYGEIQDSILNLLGLKTISIMKDGSLVQTDSIFQRPGRWSYNPESRELFMNRAGIGLELFSGSFVGIRNDTMRVIEIIEAKGEQIKLTWHLKRIDDKKTGTLFTKEENWWRKNDSVENAAALKKKVKAILNYYALYYEMVSKESAYFIQSRVLLPFNYYQHGMGLKPFNDHSAFSGFFYNTQQAGQAHDLLSAAMGKIKEKDFPSGKNFVIEYSLYLSRLADAIKN
jgi:hypothetical protein